MSYNMVDKNVLSPLLYKCFNYFKEACMQRIMGDSDALAASDQFSLSKNAAGFTALRVSLFLLSSEQHRNVMKRQKHEKLVTFN